LTRTDQSAFSILATKLHRIESALFGKKSCATVKMLRDLACHTSNFVAEHEFREKVARVTSVLNMTRFTVYIVFSEHQLVLVNFATVINRNRVKGSTTVTEIWVGLFLTF